uniref:Hypothetical chloroplast RF19 n=1 Tax=Neottia acuminata TaxID=707309 RepID=A0A1B1QC51_9ASPA|nr:hypothetical chloroplast RF19 [Neottia acuminata]ANT72847.1 hypothetical chloroplast RF19 [Neottia acuminata]
MILKSFLLGKPLSLCIKIINSVVMVGLYYGFLTTFSIGPSYLFLLRARVMKEGTEKEVSATTGFLVGQLMMFISIYYAPLHLALGRPHTITVLVLPYLLFHFFWNNNKNFFDSGSTTRNSMRNLSIQCVFLNNLIFQLFNHFILPSSTLARLVNIFMFRCNNKILFLTSSFVGWLIGHIFFMKWVGLILFWMEQNHSIRSNKYLVLELRNYMARIFSIILFITCVYYLGRMPSPIVTKKLKDKETSETEERGKRKKESDVETTSETKETKQEQEGLDKIEEKEKIRVNGKEKTKDEFYFQEAHYLDSSVYKDFDLETHHENWELGILKEEKKKRMNWIWVEWVEKPFVTFFFDYKRWNRPLRYIKNDQLENALRNEMSQFFFFTCKSDGKKIISFTYPPSLSTFSKMLEKRISLYIIEKLYDEYFYNSWIYTNEKKKCNLKNELRSRIKIIEKNEEFPSLDMLEKRTILCDDENKKKCLPKTYDPFFNGSYRGTRKKLYLRAIMNPYTDTKDLLEIFLINKIHDLLIKDSVLNDSVELYRQSFLNSTEEKGICSESKAKSIGIRIEEISKEVSRWSYKLTDELEEEENEEELAEEDSYIHSRRAKRVVISKENDQNINDENDNQIEEEEVSLIDYSQQSDFRRNLIKGSMRAQRRKTVIWGLFQVNLNSPFFFDRLDKTFFFSSFYINEIKNIFLRNWMGREQESESKISDFDLENKDTKEEKEKEKKIYINDQIEIYETGDTFIFAQALRSFTLLIQSFLRKYIILPSLIIAKNILRILLFQSPEWDEDFKELNREIHIKCTYSGVQLSETEFPQDWLTEGIQIKIISPFCLKPWQKSKVQSHNRNSIKKKSFCFLTVYGMEAKIPFSSPRKQPFFFKPFFKELKKNKVKKNFLQVLKFLKKEKKYFLKVRKEEIKWVIKIVRVIKLIMKNLEKVIPILLFEFRKEKVYETNKNKKDFKRNNQILRESTVLIRKMNWLNYSLIEKRTKDLSDKTIKIRNQIEQIAKDKKKKEMVLIYDNKRSGSQKHIWKVLKSKNIRLMRKSHYFIKSFIEKIYIDILFCTISKINAQLFFESTKKIINKYIYNNERNQEPEGIDETNKNKMNLNLTITNFFSNTDNTWNLSYLSQAYVFYKLSQTQLLNQLLNQSHLRPVLQYQGSYPFFKDKLKDYCLIHGIFNSKPRHNKIHTYEMNEWKNWLKGHYQYDLSQKKKSRLVPKEWRNRINQRRTIQNKESIKFDLYQKYKWKKHYRYDLLSYKYISFPNSYISGSTLEINGDPDIPYHLNTLNTSKPESFYVLISIPNNDYLEKGYLIDRNTNLDRKYFDCKILHLFFINNIEIWTNAHIGIKVHENTKTETKIKNLQKMKKKNLFSSIIDQDIKSCNQTSILFDCMGMNQERFYGTALNQDTISNLEPWLFPEFVLLFDIYKIKPWIIPIKSLFLNFYRKKNIHKDHENIVLNLLKRKKKKVLEEDYARLEIQKGRKNQSKNENEMDLDSFLKKYFLFQLRWTNLFDQKILKNIKIYCLLLRLINTKEITISSIQRGEINIDEMLIHKDPVFAEVIRKGIFLIEPICLSKRRGGKSIIYQTMDISLVDNKKHQSNKKYKKNIYSEKGGFAKHSNIFWSGYKNHYDFIIPENILSSRRRREFRILICFNSKYWNVVDKNPIFCNENKIRNCGQFLNEDKHINKDKKNFMKFKLFLWPNYRLEDVACMNRYWFDTNNSSRFSMSRIHMY